jgi:hypothetical protein
MKPSQVKPLGNFQFRNAQQLAPKPNAPYVIPVIADVPIVASRGTI